MDWWLSRRVSALQSVVTGSISSGEITVSNADDTQLGQNSNSLFLYVMRMCSPYYLLLLYNSSQILSTLQIILRLVFHKPMKWDSDNLTLL